MKKAADRKAPERKTFGRLNLRKSSTASRSGRFSENPFSGKRRFARVFLHFFSKECVMSSIYVGNLSHTATENDLRDAFGQFGAVADVSIIKDRETGRPRGFAFVEMTNANEAATAIQELNLKEIAGRAISVNEARPKTSSGPRRGGGGGGGAAA
jgi:RNA recognition motif-containing protein